MKIQMVSIFVNDVNAAFKFYTETLLFKELMYMPEMHLAIVVSPEQPDGTSLLLEPNQNPIASDYQKKLWDANLPVMTFSATDIYAEYDRLVAAGVKFRKTPTKQDWGIEAVFEDTCGNLVQLAAIN